MSKKTISILKSQKNKTQNTQNFTLYYQTQVTTKTLVYFVFLQIQHNVHVQCNVCVNYTFTHAIKLFRVEHYSITLTRRTFFSVQSFRLFIRYSRSISFTLQY